MKRLDENPPLWAALFASLVLLYLLTGNGAVVGTAAGALIIALVAPQMRVDRILQIMLGVVSFSIGALLIWMVSDKTAGVPPSRIGPMSAGAALGFFFVAATRAIVADATGKTPLTCGFVFLSVLSMGAVETGLYYPVFSLGILGLLSAAVGRPGRPQRIKGSSRTFFRRSRIAFSVAAFACAIASALILSLPILYDAAFGLITGAYAKSQKGFAFGMALGDLNDIADSDEVVMRIRGRRADYLRGAVYTRYDNGRWRASASDRAHLLPTTRRGSGSQKPAFSETEIEFVGGDRSRFFVPLFGEVEDLSPSRGFISKSGLVSVQEDEETDWIRFTVADGADSNEAPGIGEKLVVPKSISEPLKRIAFALSENEQAPTAMLNKLSSRLKRDYVYSLSASFKTGKDPILAFLTDSRQGNCEYFASAMALLTASLGIPVRVVGGYRVHEYNPIGGYYVVREKNAHSWVEAYVEGKGWVTVDPTPQAEETFGTDGGLSWTAALVDTAADRLRRFGRFWAHLTAVEIGGAVIALVFVWMSIRAARVFRRKKEVSAIARVGYSAPHPSLLRLLRALERVGEKRATHEPLERFAERIRTSASLPGKGPVFADLLLRYSDWRYGNIGDPLLIAKDVDELLARWRGR